MPILLHLLLSLGVLSRRLLLTRLLLEFGPLLLGFQFLGRFGRFLGLAVLFFRRPAKLLFSLRLLRFGLLLLERGSLVGEPLGLGVQVGLFLGDAGLLRGGGFGLAFVLGGFLLGGLPTFLHFLFSLGVLLLSLILLSPLFRYSRRLGSSGILRSLFRRGALLLRCAIFSSLSLKAFCSSLFRRSLSKSCSIWSERNPQTANWEIAV